MKKRNIFKTGVLVLALGFFATSCSSNEASSEQAVEDTTEVVEADQNEEVVEDQVVEEEVLEESAPVIEEAPKAETKDKASVVKETSKTEAKVSEPVPVKKQVAKEAKPAITFQASEYDFGDIKEGDKVNYTFSFTNSGTAPLIISNARASCGCTVPSWPKEPVMPGDTGEIEVEFNSRGKSGRQNKSITITTNVSEQPEVLYLKGNIQSAPASN